MIVVEKDEIVRQGSGFSSEVVVVPSRTYTFDADHWHEIAPKSDYGSPALDIIDSEGETVASFLPYTWSRVYFDSRASKGRIRHTGRSKGF